MPRDSTRDLSRAHDRDDRFISLKRRVAALARFSEPIVPMADGPWAVRIAKVTHPVELLTALREVEGPVPWAVVSRFVRTARGSAAPTRIDQALVAIARRELRALATPAALAMAKEHRRAFARYGRIDEAWLQQRARDVDRAHDALEAPRLDWFSAAVEIVRARGGDQSALRLRMAHDEVIAAATERRKRARERVRAIVTAMNAGATSDSDDPEIAMLAERLDAARDFPGRARRRRALDVLRTAIGWKDAPADAVASLAEPSARVDFGDRVLRAGWALADAIPAVRDPKERERALEDLAVLALAFPIRNDGIAALPADVARADVLRLTETGVSAAQAVALASLKLKSDHDQLARWVAQGLDIAHVAEAMEKGFAGSLARVPDVRAANAYAKWAARLVPHYKALGISFSLAPELFAALPRNVDLGVLAVCVLEATKLDDPAAVLDATLGLFATVPAKATRILTRLKSVENGAARKAFGDFAEWLGEDELLDRLVHVARLAGESQPLTHRIREDFDHATKTARELAHLESMNRRNVPQEGRLALLRKGPRSIDDAPKGRTKRRIAERIEALMPVAYRRELDVVFREISREAWGVDVPSLTPAWRDAVRFWLVVDDNKSLLGTLLRERGKHTQEPAHVKLSSAKNRAWLKEAGKTIDVEQWLAPRSASFSTPSGTRYVIALEEDPLEVLRMGIPFGTCLSLEDGCNAASTVLNAFDANKRVIYVRGPNGKVVARKLLALNESLALIGYNLYCSASGDEEIVIRRAVDKMCRDIARDVGTRLAVAGEPKRIHEGFWYDDGVVAFEEDEVVTSYCRAFKMTPPKKTWSSFVDDARGWVTLDRGDFDGAIDVLGVSDRSISGVILGRGVVDGLGLREATRRMRNVSKLLPAICRVMADGGPDGIVRAFEVLGGRPDNFAQHAVPLLLDRAPRSDAIAMAFVRAAEKIVARDRRIGRWGAAHRTYEDVGPLVESIGCVLDSCDRLTPLWREIGPSASCTDCLERGERSMFAAARIAYTRAPDDAAVVSCLMSARRSPLAHRIAVCIAARHFLDGGDRAMRRFLSHSQKKPIASHPDTLAAIVRQAGFKALRAWKAPSAASAPMFEALGPLLFSLPFEDVSALVARGPEIADDEWAPGPWELAWRRRHPDEKRSARLLADAMRKPYSATRARELLALLADEDAHAALESARAGGRPPPSDPPALGGATTLKEHVDIELAYKSLVAQVNATAAGHFEAEATPVEDRLYVERALDALPRTAERIATQFVAFEHLLRAPASAAVDSALATALEKVRVTRLDPLLVAELWQRRAVREALVKAYVKAPRAFGASMEAVERAAVRAGLNVDGFLEAAVRAQVETSPSSVLYCESLDQLREVLAVVVRECEPAKAAAVYVEINDLPAAAAFLRALERELADRQAAIRGAMVFEDDDDRHLALKAWLQKKRLSERTK